MDEDAITDDSIIMMEHIFTHSPFFISFVNIDMRYNQKVLKIKSNLSDERNWKMVSTNILSKFDNNSTLQYSDGWMKNKGRGTF